MARIVLGMGTSHGPMLVTPPETWGARVSDDRLSKHHFEGREWSFDELVDYRRAENLSEQVTLNVWKARHAQCLAAIEEMARVLAEARPDVVVIVGNDQMEIFDADCIPALSVMCGPTIVNNMISHEKLQTMPPGVRHAMPGYMPDTASYDGVPELAKHIIKSAIADDFDVAALQRLSEHETPHAFGFVFRQLMKDQVIPTVPVLVNTFYPPNQPTVKRCHAFGRSVGRAIQSWDSDARVAVIASGGLTHFVIDERVDNLILNAMKNHDFAPVFALGEEIFQAGTSEIKNWIPVAGVMDEIGFDMTVVDYVPCYRSEAGTGNAMGFVYWKPQA
ncbi:DODA-type extradiol aromatic ring-opening family dioxygenase [Paraburkholderia rhynchosiae]|uniref:2,3-dihydroxyphenylpropionate/2, 3-dihydroxicinnamic acid 1,2-dioxygenase n=1 Tax=Paraburkholderia rhynchosiae TaxID=487049 RepID=A0A2N7WDN8_9BURK|nr:protocatechuate 3,4-dioxygenase [Paraburkholderia rhynchosiae]PMS27493.1 protocatechuate 3,4-dioxygenase [Paraburkholderia rhynchosiae]CAB3723686.1 2,3-dihydroxyphenylpropionate/2, 3-dihydroxicinnamic acid 1,2-dioxygenase [Paraburkholderia rhynchosiae]